MNTNLRFFFLEGKMIDIAEVIEEKIKNAVAGIDGIIGLMKYYKPTQYPSYCIEAGITEVQYKHISTLATEKPFFTLNYIEQVINQDLNPDTRYFLKNAQAIVEELKTDLSLNGLVTKFEMRTKMYIREQEIKENIFEIKIMIDERRD